MRLLFALMFLLPPSSDDILQNHPEIAVVDNEQRIIELWNTDEYLIADAIIRRYGSRTEIVTTNLPNGRKLCYARLFRPGEKWVSSGHDKTEAVIADCQIDGWIAMSKLMRPGLNKHERAKSE